MNCAGSPPAARSLYAAMRRWRADTGCSRADSARVPASRSARAGRAFCRSSAPTMATRLGLPAWAPAPKPMPDVVAGLGLADAVETLWYDTGYALIVVEDEAQVRDAPPRFACARRDWRAGRDRDRAGRRDRRRQPRLHALLRHRRRPRHGLRARGDDALLGRTARPRQRLPPIRRRRAAGMSGVRLDGDRVVLTGRCVTVLEGVFLL